MKKTIIITLLGVVSISAFSQSKTIKAEIKTNQPAISDSTFALKKEQAIALYGLLDACKEAALTTVSKKITVVDAHNILEAIATMQKAIFEKYGQKQALPVNGKPKQ